VHALFLVAYLVLPLVVLWRSRSLAWTVIVTGASMSVVGVVVNFLVDHVSLLTWTQLQWLLLVALGIPVVVAFIARPHQHAPRRRQVLTIGVPVVGLGAFLAIVMTLWTEQPAFLTPVNFLMGHAVAEDNAKWLDFAAFLASGGPVDQSVPMGGPLQLFLVFVATLMAVVSQLALGGVNEVLVAANTVIYGQYALVALAPLALAPFAEARLRSPDPSGPPGRRRVPVPLIWTGMLVLVVAVLMVTAYGHLTLQWTMIVAALWASAYLVRSAVPRAQLLTSMIVAAGMTVWLPMNAIAAVLVIGWLVVLVARIVRQGRAGADWIGLATVLVVGVSIAEPLRSSVAFVLGSTPSASGMAETVVAGMGSGVRAAAALVVPALGPVVAGLTESTLFEAGGGTEVATSLLVGLAAVTAVAAALVVSRQGTDRGYVRLLPIGLLAGFALALNALDQWATGSAPHYGSLKFTFMVVIVVAASALPIGMLAVDGRQLGMTAARWTAVGAVVMVLVVDGLLVRSIAAARPDQWSPEIPFDNPRSYWWPADVNGTAVQPIADNPVACVYLPQGAKAPSGILESQLSDPQRVYSCTRLLAGLAGEDAGAQPLVDWLRREWLTNTRAWADVHGYLSGMPDSVLDRPVILLDDGSNVIGLESVRTLLARYPAEAGLQW
jgi:hypothetical protein